MPIVTATPQMDGTSGYQGAINDTWESVQDSSASGYNNEGFFFIQTYEWSFQNRKTLYRNFLRFVWPSGIPTNAIIKRMVLKIRMSNFDPGTPYVNTWHYLDEWTTSLKVAAGTNTDSSWPGNNIFNDFDRTKITNTINTDILNKMKNTRYPWTKFGVDEWTATEGKDGYDFWQYYCTDGTWLVDESVGIVHQCYVDASDPWIKLEIDGTLLTEMRTRFAAWTGASDNYANLPNFAILCKSDYIEHDDSDFVVPPTGAGEYNPAPSITAYSSATSDKEPILEITYSTEPDAEIDNSNGTTHIGSNATIHI